VCKADWPEVRRSMVNARTRIEVKDHVACQMEMTIRRHEMEQGVR
jgi:hypothetical protein